MKRKTIAAVEKTVRDVIYSWKPFEWASDDVNDPEFNGEVKGIAKQIDRMSSARDTAAVIAGVFRSPFSDDRISEEKYEEAGAKLYCLLKRQRLIK